MDKRTDTRIDTDARKGNEQTFVAHLARQLMQQDSNLLMSEAAHQARQLYAQGVRDLYR